MARLVCSVALVLMLAACGGSSSRDDTPAATGGLSQGSEPQPAVTPEAGQTFSFQTIVLRDSIVELGSLRFTSAIHIGMERPYLISNRQELSVFNTAFPGSQVITQDQLFQHTYFLIPASDCPVPSKIVRIDYRLHDVTITVDRFQTAANAVCTALQGAEFHLLRGNKLPALDVPFEPVEIQGQSQIRTERSEVIASSSAWRALWEEHHRHLPAPPPFPQIDFSHRMVIGVYLGTRPNGCYTVRIERIYEADGKTIVEYTEQVPGPGRICTLALVWPSHLVVIPRTGTSFEFRKTVRNF